MPNQHQSAASPGPTAGRRAHPGRDPGGRLLGGDRRTGGLPAVGRGRRRGREGGASGRGPDPPLPRLPHLEPVQAERGPRPRDRGGTTGTWTVCWPGRTSSSTASGRPRRAGSVSPTPPWPSGTPGSSTARCGHGPPVTPVPMAPSTTCWSPPGSASATSNRATGTVRSSSGSPSAVGAPPIWPPSASWPVWSSAERGGRRAVRSTPAWLRGRCCRP